MMTAMEIIWSF